MFMCRRKFNLAPIRFGILSVVLTVSVPLQCLAENDPEAPTLKEVIQSPEGEAKAQADEQSPVFDALTSKRPYEEPMSFEKTMAILQEGSENHFDPELLAAFVKIAPQLYQKYCGREDAGLHEELEAILRHYFTTDVRSLMT